MRSRHICMGGRGARKEIFICKSRSFQIYCSLSECDSLLFSLRENSSRAHAANDLKWSSNRPIKRPFFSSTHLQNQLSVSQQARPCNISLPNWVKNSKHKFSVLLFFTSALVRGEACMSAGSVYLDFACQSRKFPTGENRFSIFMTK